MEVDLLKLTAAQRRLVLDAALKTRDMDNLLLLSKIQQRLSRCSAVYADVLGLERLLR